MAEEKKLTDEEMAEFISTKISAEDADPQWWVALTLLQLKPVLVEIAAGIAPDTKGKSVAASIDNLSNKLGQIIDKLR